MSRQEPKRHLRRASSSSDGHQVAGTRRKVSEESRLRGFLDCRTISRTLAVAARSLLVLACSCAIGVVRADSACVKEASTEALVLMLRAEHDRAESSGTISNYHFWYDEVAEELLARRSFQSKLLLLDHVNDAAIVENAPSYLPRYGTTEGHVLRVQDKARFVLLELLPREYLEADCDGERWANPEALKGRLQAARQAIEATLRDHRQRELESASRRRRIIDAQKKE